MNTTGEIYGYPVIVGAEIPGALVEKPAYAVLN